MTDIFDSLKKTWIKGMEAVSSAASNLANNTKQKVNEINLDNRRREILSDFGLIAYELWQKGMELPKELNDLMVELSQVDEALNLLRIKPFLETTSAEDNHPTPEDEMPLLVEEEPAVQERPAETEEENQ